MTSAPRIRAYASGTDEYHDAFRVFLAHTDQKTNTKAWLEDVLLERLPGDRRHLVDAGAGNGQTTAWLLPYFVRTTAIEPNPSLGADLTAACPSAVVEHATIADSSPEEEADLVLCSHVLYYVPRSEWVTTVKTMASWLRPEGVLVIVLQDARSDCMRMLQHFTGQHYDLETLRTELRGEDADRFQVEMERVPARVLVPGVAPALVIAEFMLNLVRLDDPPLETDVRAYLESHFRRDDSFRFSVDQQLLVLRRRPSSAS